MERFLDVRDLNVEFGSDRGVVRAVNHVSFHINKGETIGLVGETGAGKTTTALSIMQLVPGPHGRITAGELLFEGEDLLKKSEREMRKIRGGKISMIFQDPMTSLNPVVTVGDQIAEVIKLHSERISRQEIRKRAENMLELVGIPAARYEEYPHQFSGGMKQRVVIAIALACNPELLIADEPTTALDVTIQAQILELMMELKDKLGMAIIMITHDLGVVASMCERIAVMYAGRIVEYGTIDDIFYHSKHQYTKGLIRSIPRLDTKEHERLIPIEGTPVDMLNPPKGCPFAPRCDEAMKICLREMPPVTEFGEVHYTQCWLNQKEEMEKGASHE